MFGFFKNRREKRLVDVIAKRNNLQEGIFANINNDLNDSMTQDAPPMLKMAYAYARRTAAAGLYLQGVFTYDDYRHASMMFRVFQMKTGHTKEFQIEAAEQAREYVRSYDSRLSDKFQGFIVTMMEQNGEELVQPNPPFSYEMISAHLLDYLERF